MYLTTHATIGLLIARVVPNPILAFIIGFISHYILDIIPHDIIIKDQNVKKKILSGEINFKDRPEFKTFLVMGIIDLIILILFCFYLFYFNLTLDPVTSFFAILGTILPDFLWTPYAFFKIKAFKIFQILNNEANDLLPPLMPTWLGTALQIVFIVVVLYLMYFP